MNPSAVSSNLPIWLFLIAIGGAVVLFAISLWLARKGFAALKTGVALTATRAEHRRQDMPFLYWLTVSLQFINAGACLLIGLALFVGPIFITANQLGPRDRGRPEAEETAIGMALESYQADNGAFPPGDNVAITRALIGYGTDKKMYLEWPRQEISSTGELLDPWGTPYRITFPDNKIAIRSAGPNRRFSDRDDIVQE